MAPRRNFSWGFALLENSSKFEGGTAIVDNDFNHRKSFDIVNRGKQPRRAPVDGKRIMKDYEQCRNFATHYFGPDVAAITMEASFGAGPGPHLTNARAVNPQGEILPLRKLTSRQRSVFEAELSDLNSTLMLGRWMTILPASEEADSKDSGCGAGAGDAPC